MATSRYKLSCAIFGHSGDVRSVTTTKDGKIVSGSRDMTAKLWSPNESGLGYRECLTLSSHQNFVSCVCALQPNEKFTNGLIITGSNDKAIRLFDGIQSLPIKILNGHLSTVCKIVPGIAENTILSSSWDQTAKIWDLVSCRVITSFSGHEAAVWSVIQLSCGAIATGSADKKIKVWIKNGTCLKTLMGHSDCVRDLAPCAPQEILSCSNDTTIRHWNVETGHCLNVFYGHSHFIYSIIDIDAEHFLTSSEDSTVKLWFNGEVIETISIPAHTVWSVAATPNGDIVTGSSDGVIRVFSSDSSRHASPEELKAYEAEISNRINNPAENTRDFKFSELPGKEALLEKGAKEGQTKLIRVDDKVMAYTWSEVENNWNLVGNVTGSREDEGVGQTGKPMYGGQEYDYVFSVDIDAGKPMLKLPYNKTDDPWQAAQKFIHDNNLSQNFLDEVANFIIKNSDSGIKQASKASHFVDPFTGEARYIPSSDTSNTQSKRSGPLINAESEAKNLPTSSTSYFPQREFLRFDQANISLILEKLLEFNKRSEDGRVTISDDRIEGLVKTCETGATFRMEDVETLNKLLEWREGDVVFPVLDVMRLVIRNEEANNLLCTDKLIPKLLVYLSPDSGMTSNSMLALRVLTNMISGEAGLNLAKKNKFIILNIIDNMVPPYSKAVQVAMSTLLLNISVMLRRSETPDGRAEGLLVIQHVLSKFTDQEALFRALVALGTLLVDMINVEKYSASFESILMKHLTEPSSKGKIQQCCQQLLQVLQ